jgi:hypothetical protein
VKRLALAGLLAIGACAAPGPRPVDFSEAPRNYGPGDYERVRRAWSRHAKVVKDIGTVIELWAVFKSWDFRQAYVERYARLYDTSEADKRALYTAQLDASRRSYEFHIAAQMTDWKWNDLEKPSSPWRITLSDAGGVEVGARSIEALKLPDLYESQLFPDRTVFSRTYLVRFDRAEVEAAGFTGPRSGRIMLRALSPLARAELVWQAR